MIRFVTLGPIYCLCLMLLALMPARADAMDRVDSLLTLSSFQKTGGFWTMDYQGDYEDILQELNNLILSDQHEPFQPTNCSLISGIADPERLYYGRNFDNPILDALVARYSPPGGYSSLAVTRMSDMGYPVGIDFETLSAEEKADLVQSPFWAADGINSAGLAVGLAYVPGTLYQPDVHKDSIFITLLVRRILDQAATCAEALTIANTFNVFDSGGNHNILSHHLLVADQSGNSCILEFYDGAFHLIEPVDDWQVLTNTSIHDHSFDELCTLCWRYETLFEGLGDVGGAIPDWRAGLDLLAQATWNQGVEGTRWSWLADINQPSLYLAIDRNFSNIARLNLVDFACLNYGDIDIVETIRQDEDGDSFIEPGETVSISITLKADFPTPGLSATLSSTFPGLSITDPEVTFDDLEACMTVSNAECPFTVVAPDVSGTYVVPMQVTFSTTYGYQCVRDIQMQMHPLAASDETVSSLDTSLTSHPNPFNPETTITYYLSEPEIVTIEIFNVRGQKIRTLINVYQKAGTHDLVWNGLDDKDQSVSGGVMICRMKVGDKSLTRKLSLLK